MLMTEDVGDRDVGGKRRRMSTSEIVANITGFTELRTGRTSETLRTMIIVAKNITCKSKISILVTLVDVVAIDFGDATISTT